MQDLDRVPNELKTLRDWVRWGASRFQEAGLSFGHGTDNAIDEAAALVLHSLHLPMDLNAAFWDGRLTAAESEAVLARIRRRIRERMPLPYLTHEAWFGGLAFYVDPRVLIPRSPLAELIEQGFQPWLDPNAVHRVLDVGTGSGCIAIACGYAFPQARVDAVDNSADALEVARINVQRHHMAEQVSLHESDLFSALPAERRYDLIVSNPPYVDRDRMESLPPEYRHEPADALAAGEDGMACVHRLLAEARERLTDNGLLVVEVGATQAAVDAAYPDLPLTWLEFERGGEGVFLITAEELARHAG
ncbi:50S ribosomal protein L3 N(5)-glutamine methyltransferase [Ectothiorhodospiraceae bacterium WFHF3C12]|nr:50S ribosomal protein L3 N(5)-glutamine methyltransferase [Ectothiorhodospiraceae bacterium WFHF3C12]